MVDNPTKIYNDYVRANLPNSMSYDTGTDRYDINSHSFFKFKNSNWYFNYISKYGYSALSAYAVNNFEPALVFDFVGNYFRKSATASTFGASITHAATTNATMVDSDGLLKWRPHNLLKYSEDFSNAAWTKANTATLALDAVGPDGATSATTLVDSSAGGSGSVSITETALTVATSTTYTYSLFAKADQLSWFNLGARNFTTPANSVAFFDLSTGVTGTVSAGLTANIEDVGGGWYHCSITFTTDAADTLGDLRVELADANNDFFVDLDGTSSILIYGAQFYRSDLGGMVNNPDTSNSYVPTTTAAVYAPRRGHHIYNGSAWVNEGILHESEARTNVATYSNDFGNLAYLKWLPANITVTPNSAISPDGTTNATKFDMASNGYIRKLTGHAPTEGQTYTFSVWIKAGTASEVSTAMLFNGGGLGYTLLTHTLTNEWQRFNITKTVPSGTPDQVRVRIVATQAGTIFVYGAQVEEGATSSSYIPTAATVTRAAETLTVPAANLPYDSTNMSIQIDGKMNYADRNLIREVQFVEWLADSNNGIEQFACSGTGFFPNGAVAFFQEAAATTSLKKTPAATLPFGVNVPFNISSRHGSTFLNGAVSGTALTADTAPTALPNLSSTDLNLGFDFMGTIGEFRMWSDDLGDVGITEATLPSTEPSLSLTFDGSENSFIVLDWSE